MDGWMYGWMDGWMGGWVDGWMGVEMQRERNKKIQQNEKIERLKNRQTDKIGAYLCVHKRKLSGGRLKT